MLFPVYRTVLVPGNSIAIFVIRDPKLKTCEALENIDWNFFKFNSTYNDIRSRYFYRMSHNMVLPLSPKPALFKYYR